MSTWALVLAGGDGRRLQRLTRDGRGRVVPKQYCALHDDAPLIRLAVERAARLAPRDRIAAVVAMDHRRWWRRDLRDLHRDNVIAQPRNRGTAPGVLLPVLHILGQDPDAVVVAFPADHYVADEPALADAARRAVDAARSAPGTIVLLGITPTEPDTSQGWIEPAAPVGAAPVPVRRFVEKPPAALATRLHADGALWNSFVFAGTAQALLAACVQFLPAWRDLVALAGAWRGDAGDWLGLRSLYERLPACDLSRDVFEPAVARLQVVRVAPCGWTDLGTAERVSGCVQTIRTVRPARHAPRPSRVSLARAVRRAAVGV